MDTTITVKNTDKPQEKVEIKLNKNGIYTLTCDTSYIYTDAEQSIYDLATIENYKSYFTCVAFKTVTNIVDEIKSEEIVELYFILNDTVSGSIKSEIEEQCTPIDMSAKAIGTLDDFIKMFVSGNLNYTQISENLTLLGFSQNTELKENNYTQTYSCDEIINKVQMNLIDTEISDGTYVPKITDEKFISSMNYVPDFQQDNNLFKDATKLLDRLVTDSDEETLKEIHQAYCDTLYKYSAYNKLSYGAKITLLQELGFGYALDLLLHMYDADYEEIVNIYNKLNSGKITIEEVDETLIKNGYIIVNDTTINIISYDNYVQQRADDKLTKLTIFFNFINVLKGKTIGLELVLNIVGISNYMYMPWTVVVNPQGEWEGNIEDLPLPAENCNVKAGWGYTKTVGDTVNYYIFNGVAWHNCTSFKDFETPREPITAVLDVYGAFSTDLQKKLNTFVKSYMLPLVYVTLKFTANMPNIYAFPSGAFELYHMLSMYDYYDDNNVHHQKDLTHKVSEEHWYTSDSFSWRDITVGNINSNKCFSGSVNLQKSWVEDKQGNRYSLYGEDVIIADAIGGDALNKIDTKGNISNYNGTHLSVPLEDYIEVDFTTGNQKNPYWENGVFYRDTFIKFSQQLIIEAIHLAKTVEQMEEILVGDFDKEFSSEEVYLGRSTSIECLAGLDYSASADLTIDTLRAEHEQEFLNAGIPETIIDEYVAHCKIYYNEDSTFFRKYYAKLNMTELEETYPLLATLTDFPHFYEFTYTEPSIKVKNGVETNHLVFCEEHLDNNYTGIGDLGILGANDYFIYNGMLMYHGDKILQVGKDKTWTDVGASHAISEVYYTPAINNGKLYSVYMGVLSDIERDTNHLEAYTIHMERLKQVVVDNMEDEDTVEEVEETQIRQYTESWYNLDKAFWNPIETTKWTIITGYINDFYTAFGICDGRLYKLYKNPYYGDVKEDGSPEPMLVYQIMDNEQGWTYITGVDYSETYEAYGIKNNKLYRITSEDFKEVVRTDTAKITGIEHVTYTKTSDTNYEYCTIKYTNLLGTTDKVELIFKLADEESSYKTLNTIKFNGNVQPFEIEDNIYTTTNVAVEYSSYSDIILSVRTNTTTYNCNMGFTDNVPSSYILEEKTEINGWDSSFDCISRYHHCNDDYTTYGIADGKLYSIKNNEVILLDEERVWTAVCGYYNENSPRTYAYAISNGNLYELKGNTIAQVANSNVGFWSEIHGCTTATNNFVIGICKTSASAQSGKLYKINAKTLATIDNATTWTSCFGRYTTSTAASNNCFGYGVKNNKLYQLTKDGISVISGFWKLNGENAIVKLEDYNINSITTHLPNGTTLVGEQAIKEIAPVSGTQLSDYDIYAIYTTKGFNNNTRYIIRTELSDYNYTYIHPIECRSDVWEDHCEELFDTFTGLMTGFIQRNVEINGADIIDGNGIASSFAEKNTYLTIKPYEESNVISMNINFKCICTDENLHPITFGNGNTNLNQTGLYYGFYNNQYGVFIKYRSTSGFSYLLVKALSKNHEGFVEVKFITNSLNLVENGVSYRLCDVALVESTGLTYIIRNRSDRAVSLPKLLGGNGSIFGDAEIYLVASYITTTEGTIRLFENGKYFSLLTQKQDLIEKIHTDETQATQKVIEITKENGEVLELSMDNLYTEMVPTCTKGDLTVSTDYSVNNLRSDNYEGLTKATLNFEGAYKLDSLKIDSNIDLDAVCDFSNTGIAEHLVDTGKIVSFNLNTNVSEPIYIKSGDIVTNQMLYKTEEGTAYTNKYLLESEVSKTSSLDCYVAPLGIMYELNTNEPKTVTKTLTYNGESFEIDDTKIEGYEKYYYDSYNATITFSPETEYDSETQTVSYIDAFATIRLDSNDVKQSDGSTKGEYSFKINATTANEEFMRFDNHSYNTIIGDSTYKFDILKKFVRINNNWVTVTETATEPKDKLQYLDGQCWNYNALAYQKLKSLTSTNGFVLCVITDDDTSKEQGIFGYSNGVGFGIKDNMWTYTDANKITHKSNVIAKDNELCYIAFRKNNNKFDIQISVDNENWKTLFESIPIYANATLGCGNVGTELLYYNGTIDLSRSYILNSNERLYIMEQITKLYRNNTLIDTITTEYAVNTFTMGYHFTGTLDCYDSDLLISSLCWVENRVALDTAVKRAMKAADASYDPTIDENTYTIEEYGVFLEEEPKRWDTITVTYKTVDKAFYMKPNTEYTIQMDVIDDHESGKSMVDLVGSLTLENGILSNFENGYATLELPSNGYTVLKYTTDASNQAIVSYVMDDDDTPSCIFIENGKLKYFDDVTTHELISISSGTYYLKLYADYGKEIEISTDGETYTSTGVVGHFTNYATFALGIGHINGVKSYFKGSFDLTQSYTANLINNKYTINNLFRYYKKITPYIIDNGVQHALVLTPLLTVQDTIDFAYEFNGQIFMEQSNLILPNTRNWRANQIKVFETVNGEKVLRDVVIRDHVEVDPIYTTEEEIVEINPSDLQVYFPESPKIGSQIVLTYNTWFLFREKDTDYEFKITYKDDIAYISYKKEDTDEETYHEYIIYYTEKQDFKVNTGYQLNGTLSIKDSTRGGMKLCDHIIWYSYTTKYKKYGDTEWQIWHEFMSDNAVGIKQLIGYDLLGKHYLPTSWFKTSLVEVPFVSFYNQAYIKPIGNLAFNNGVVSNFSDENYLAVVMDAMHDGYKISFFVTTTDGDNQGISTWLRSLNGYFKTDEPSEIDTYQFKPNYPYIIQYFFGGYGLTVHEVDIMKNFQLEQQLIKYFNTQSGEIGVRVLGYGVGTNTFEPTKQLGKTTVTIIPYNPKREEGSQGYYVTTKAQAKKVKVYYRKVENPYDHYTEEGLDTWYPITLSAQDITYFDKTLSVYAANIDFGFASSATTEINYNPDGVEYYKGDVIEFKVVSNETTYISTIPYNTQIKRQRAIF